jgi:hypothetical protein
MKARPVSKAELTKAVKQFTAGTLASRKTNETCTVQFKVETVARIHDITEPGVQEPLEILLLDTRNGDQHTTPTERAAIVVPSPTLPANALARAASNSSQRDMKDEP